MTKIPVANNSFGSTLKVKKTAEIIEFPKDRIFRVHTVEGFQEQLIAAKIDFINYLVNKHTDALFARLRLEGVILDGPESVADSTFIYEAIKSFLYRLHGLEHPLHDFVDENFTGEVTEMLKNAREHDDGYIPEDNDDEDDEA